MLTQIEEYNDTHGTLYGLTSREMRAVMEIAGHVCCVNKCKGTKSDPCGKHFAAAEKFFKQFKK